MRNFRQGEYGRVWTNGDPHRSKWPEADTLRRITGEYHRDHPPGPGSNAFPRAELGLPIQFKFKDSKDDLNNCELLPVNDRGEESTRMASPLILRPLAASTDKAYAMVVRFNTPGVKQAKLKQLKVSGRPIVSPALNRAVPTGEIRSAAAAYDTGSPLAGYVSAVDAFLAYCGSRL